MSFKASILLGEKIARSLGMSQVRVRLHNDRSRSSFYIPIIKRIYLEKGLTAEDLMMTLLHEIGHPFLNYYYGNIIPKEAFARLFGNKHKWYFGKWFFMGPEQTLEYLEGIPVQKGYVSSYCHVHPIEDFAETFSVALADILGIKKFTSKDTRLKKKVRNVQTWIRKVALIKSLSAT